MKLGIIASHSDSAKIAANDIRARYTVIEDLTEADVIVVLGGDGTMLDAIHSTLDIEKPLYGINCGHVGFLMNEFSTDIEHKIHEAQTTHVHPLFVSIEDADNRIHAAYAVNDVSVTRASGQAAKLSISVNGITRIDELIGDGVIVSTPVGSTAYNLSAGGPILPFEAPLNVITPICAFRPRRWKGAIIPNHLPVQIDVLESKKRRVNLVADSKEIQNVTSIRIGTSEKTILIMSDPGRSWSEKLLNEQFAF